MNEGIQLVVAPEMYLMQIQALQRELIKKDEEIARLSSLLLDYERRLREDLECKMGAPDKSEQEKKRKPKRVVTEDTKSYSDFKSDGKRKAHAADAIRSYSDFKAIQQYYLDGGRIRDWAMWTIGVSLGLRISDLLALKFGNLIDADKKTFKQRIQIYEQKTGKLNNCLITESVINAMSVYLDSIKWEFDLDGYLFPSKKTKGKMYEECGWRILSDAGKALNLPINIGSHTMRKSFANIAACVDKSSVDMNAITKIQGLLNHGDQRVTLTYLGSYQEMFDRSRIAVSEFVLGRSGVDDLVAGSQHTTDDVLERLDALEKILIESRGSQR